MPVLESDIEGKFTSYCKKVGLTSLKISRTGRRGVVDRVIILRDGGVVWIELKRPGGKMSAMQDVFATLLKNKGHTHYVTYSWEEAKNVLDSLVPRR